MYGPTSASRRDRSSPVARTAYTPYGYSAITRSSQTGYVGAVQEALRGCYGFGQGYRYLSSVLMRFETPDSLSPFEQGGLNAYAYCAGDPVNRVDPTGHAFQWLKFLKRFKRRKPTPMTVAEPAFDPKLAQSAKTVKRTVDFILRPENGADMRSLLSARLRDNDFRQSAVPVLGTDRLDRLESNQKAWETFAPGEYRKRPSTQIHERDADILRRYAAAVGTLTGSGVPPRIFEGQLRTLQHAAMAKLDHSAWLELKNIRKQL
ncbi:RHS repeat-associated core domain-containing protein [Pseudomonas sp. FYR_7]|uniref:RHS repeat-associated core domain-containing protein n=1 Tax=Pseudomonas sp. FYR_7 TaxID=3367174 RepID=UPI00370BE69C